MGTIRQKSAINKIVESRGKKPIGTAMVEAGFSPKTAKNPKNLTDSKTWKELMKEHLGDEKLSKVHSSLLNSHRLDHMLFPLGPIDDEKDKEIDYSVDENGDPGKQERTALTDKEIMTMLVELNCTVRRIVHSQQARHVYFWSPNDLARQKALELAYKLKGRLKDKPEEDDQPKQIHYHYHDERIMQIVKEANEKLQDHYRKQILTKKGK